MAQWLETLAAPPENLSSIPGTYVGAHKSSSSSKESDVLFGPLWAPGTHVHRHTCMQTHK